MEYAFNSITLHLKISFSWLYFHFPEIWLNFGPTLLIDGLKSGVSNDTKKFILFIWLIKLKDKFSFAM